MIERDPKAQASAEFRPPEHLEPPAIPDHQLLRRIGRGSYGEVWLARSVTGAYRAVKIVHRRAFDHDRPFEREFSGILKFEPISRKHDSQMNILHVGRGEDCFFYIMELADDQLTGQQIHPDSYAPKSLKSELFHRGKLPFEECVQISLSMTTALENLHSQGLVHRDIKPSNVIFVNGVVKLADIGLVTSVDASRSFVGTEGFVPPEGPGTPQADIYSLGKVLYELCTGKDRQEFPELPTDLDAWPDRDGLIELNAVIAKACRQDPRQRYTTARAMHADLLLLQSGKSLARLHATQRALAKLKRVSVVGGFTTALAFAALFWQVNESRQMKRLAGENFNLAIAGGKAAAVAEEQRQRAAESELTARREAYAADMYLAQQELKDNNLGQARRLLDRHRPRPGEEDPRGWEWRYLWQLTRSTALVTLTNWPQAGWSVSFSPDGTRLAVGWSNGRVDLWDVPGRRLIRTLTDGKKDIAQTCVAFSPVRNLLAASSETETNAVSLYDLNSGRESILWRSPGEGEWGVRDLVFSPDGSRVVIYANSNGKRGDAVWVVNVSSAKIEFHHPTGYSFYENFGAAQLSSDNQRLYLARPDGSNLRYSIECLALATGQQLWQTESLRDSGLTTLAMSPDGRVLASASGYEDNDIRVWDAATGRLLVRLEGHTHWVCKLVFAGDGRHLISAAADQSIRIWNTDTWTETKVLRGHQDEVKAVAISEIGHLVASASKNGEIMLWNDEGKQANDGYLRLPDSLLGVMPLDGSRVMLIDSDYRPELFDLRQGASLGSVPGLGPSTHNYVVGFGTNWVCLLDNRNQILVDEWNGSQFARRGAVPLVSRADLIFKAAFNPARQLVAWNEPAASNCVFLANLATPGQRIELKSEVAGLFPYRFSDDGKYLAALSSKEYAYALQVWNVDTGRGVVTSGETVMDVAFADAGRVFVAAFDVQSGHEIRFYDLEHPDRGPRCVQGKHEASRLAISADGRLAAASTQAGPVRLCDAVTGELIADLRGYGFGVAFSKDGCRLVSAGGGRHAVKLLDVGTRQELLSLSGTGPILWQALWSADGDTIIVGSQWQPWQTWHAPSWEEIAAAEAKEKAAIKQP